VQETILKLITLQDLDNKIRVWRLAEADGPAKMALAREKLTTLETELAELEGKIKANGSARRELEASTADLTVRKTTNQARQLKARNTNEYRAVLKEADTINSALFGKEDEILALMDEAEKLSAQLPSLAADREAEEKIYNSSVAEIQSIISEGQASLSQAEIQRESLIADIPTQALNRYNTVAKNKGGQAVAPVVQGLCRCCRLSVPPQLYNELQKNDKLITCPNCARILYWMHHPYFKEFCSEPEPAAAQTPEKPEKPPKGENGKKRKTSKIKDTGPSGDLGSALSAAEAEDIPPLKSRGNPMVRETQSREGDSGVVSL
jgi:predicted  nucleic acid-binding Zn-ribbon protein